MTDSTSASGAFQRHTLARPLNANVAIPVLSRTDGQGILLGAVPGDAIIEVLEIQGHWLLIRTPHGIPGYIARASVQMESGPDGYVNSAARQLGATRLSPAAFGAMRMTYHPSQRQAATNGCVAAALAAIGIVCFVIGVALVGFTQVSCPASFGQPVNPYSSACTTIGTPLAPLGVLVLIISAGAFISAVITGRRTHM